MDPIQMQGNNKLAKRSNLHKVLNFIISIPLVLLVLMKVGGVISQYMNPYGDILGSSAGLGIMMFGIMIVAFPIFVILSFFTLYLELRYIKVNLLSKKELFKAPSFYAILYVAFSIGMGVISYLAYM